MKAININGTIKLFNQLPKYWNKTDNFRAATIEMQRLFGFFDVVDPVYDPDIEELGDLTFDAENSVFIRIIITKVLPELDTLKSIKIAELKNAVKDLYSSIQWYLEMKRTENESVPQAVIDKVKLIKTKYEQLKDQINALETKVEVIKFQLPFDAIQNLQDQLDQIY